MVTMWGPPTGVSAVMTVTMVQVMFLDNECLHSSIFLYYDLLCSFTGGYKCKCGLEKTTRIVGGTEVKPVSVSSLIISASYHHSAFCSEQVPLDGGTFEAVGQAAVLRRHIGGLQVCGHSRTLRP